MNTKKILVIDDNDGHRRAICYILKKNKYDVLDTGEGELGLKLLNEFDEIRVLIVDLKIPDLSGVDILAKIKGQQQPLRRIVLTAYGEELSSKKAEKLKVFAYLNKPVEKHPLLFTVKSAFNDLYVEKLERKLQLEKQFKEIGIMTTDFVHWVGNKVSLIPNYLDLIQEEVQSISASGIEKVRKIKKIVEEVIEVKGDLLMPFRETKPEVIPVDNIMGQVITSFEKKDIEIIENYNCKGYRVSFNKTELTKIFEELINNAVNAMEGSSKKQLNIDILEGPDNRTIVRIKDTGFGIKAEDKDKIFRAFYSNKKSKGYGIGLFMVKNTLAKFGGTIEYTSKSGEGTEFTIYLRKVS